MSRFSYVAIVGQPNVGKSTLFNKLVGRRQNLVSPMPGVTRDRVMGQVHLDDEKSFWICDTGGLDRASEHFLQDKLSEQVRLAVEASAVVVFVVDGRFGPNPIDGEILQWLRKSQKPLIIVVNKIDRVENSYLSEEFHRWGIDTIMPVSAEHSLGIYELRNHLAGLLGNGGSRQTHPDVLSLAILGRPNSGKSSLLNRLIGEERSIVDAVPGTTRDGVDAYVNRFGRTLRIIDTAGIRRHARTSDFLEQIAISRAQAYLKECDVAILVMDIFEGPTEGDARVAGMAFEMRKPLIIVANKWDLIMPKDDQTHKHYTNMIRYRMSYIPYVPIIFTSALINIRVQNIIPMAIDLYEKSKKRIKTAEVNVFLKDVLKLHSPPMRRNRSGNIKFYYATQAEVSPPHFVVFCSHPEEVHFSYKRFMENQFREHFGFEHLPISLSFRPRGGSEESPQ